MYIPEALLKWVAGGGWGGQCTYDDVCRVDKVMIRDGIHANGINPNAHQCSHICAFNSGDRGGEPLSGSSKCQSAKEKPAE